MNIQTKLMEALKEFLEYNGECPDSTDGFHCLALKRVAASCVYCDLAEAYEIAEELGP